ncbi:NAD dependent epimerase/dehydratase family protein [Purpureocillium lavendulum]|uniref:NAD dependent epimerase/dehydratase family protein n=1 Tax=Purpureocillium lavendulum TaxID=1247861 RepID=A0AB34FLV8_9HYPO|nr:NAD dependent epimerase/dehydratase family protein [Purpureocillium lavendulum]
MATQMPPGTVRLTTTKESNTKLILHPKPTDDYDDPLNWSSGRKAFHYTVVLFYVIVTFSTLSVDHGAWPEIQHDLGMTDDDTAIVTTLQYAGLGLSGVAFIPLAYRYGRRPIFLLSVAIQFASAVGSAVVTNKGGNMITHLLISVGASVAMTIVPMTIADLFFVHQFATMSGLFMFAQSVGAFLGPAIAGFLVDSKGWRWMRWGNAIALAVNFAMVLFLLEESTFVPNTKCHSDIKNKAQEPESFYNRPYILFTNEEEPMDIVDMNRLMTPRASTTTFDLPPEPKSLRERFALITNTQRPIKERFLAPFVILVSFPAVAYAALTYGIIMAWLEMMEHIMLTRLDRPPYSYSPQAIGVYNLAPFLGHLLGSLVVAPLCDLWIVRLATRNGGIYHPEMRLWITLPAALFVCGGMLLFGIGIARGIPCIWPTIGFAMFAFGFSICLSVAVAYLIDCYHNMIGDAFVGVAVVRNALGAVASIGIIPWIETMGLQNVFILGTALAPLFLGIPVVLLLWGRKARIVTNDKYRQYSLAAIPPANMKDMPTQVRQRRRRFPERQLLDQIRQYEALLRQNNIKFEPLHRDSTEDKAPADDGDESDNDTPRVDVADGSLPSAPLKAESAFEVKSIWQAMTQENRQFEDSSETPVATMLQGTLKKALDELGHDDDLLFGSRQTLVDISTLHPEAVDIFRLWQVYLENADPQLKVTHSPSLQRRIVTAAKDLANVDPPLEALMFSIYCLAIFSLTEEECRAMFEHDKEDLQTRYRFGCQQALMNARYLRSTDRDCLTAFYLYLLSARFGSDPRSASAMLAVAIRIAQSMGIHKESCLAQYSPFEAEMRRRLWWSLMTYDSRMGEKCDLKDVPLAPTWDCKIPLNIDDSDLREDMKELPKAKDAATQMLCVVVRCEMADFVRNSSFHLDFTNPALKPLARALPSGGRLDALEQRIEEQYLRQCDVENPLHFLAIWMTRSYLAKCRLMQHYSQDPGSVGPQTDERRDLAMGLALRLLECDTQLMRSPLVGGYLWHLQLYFPFPAYMHILQDLRQRPQNPRAIHAWGILSDSCETRFPSPVPDSNPLFVMFGRMVLGAWDAFESGSGPVEQRSIPRIVSSTREREAARAQTMQHSIPDEPCVFMDVSATGWLTSATAGVGGDGFMVGDGAQAATEDVGTFDNIGLDDPYSLNLGSYPF